MSSLRGFALGVITGGLLVGGALAMHQPVKTKPKPEPVDWADAPARVKSYLASQVPAVKDFTVTRFSTGDTAVYRAVHDQQPDSIDAALTDKGVLLSWRRNHTGWKANVPQEVKDHVRAAMPEARVIGYNDYDSVMYMYSALVEHKGKGYKLTLSSVDGLEIEEMAEWQWSLYRDQVEKGDK